MSDYTVRRDEHVVSVLVTTETRTRELTPELSRKVRNHSPDGFEFGYSGSGPAQLALAILLDYTGNVSQTQSCYQDFKREFIANRGPQTQGFTIRGVEIEEWLAKRPKE